MSVYIFHRGNIRQAKTAIRVFFLVSLYNHELFKWPHYGSMLLFLWIKHKVCKGNYFI